MATAFNSCSQGVSGIKAKFIGSLSDREALALIASPRAGTNYIAENSRIGLDKVAYKAQKLAFRPLPPLLDSM